MTKKKNRFATLSERPVHDAVAYAMRVECQSDAFIVRAALADWVYTWREAWWTSPDGRAEPPDMDIEFQLAWNPPTYPELLWLISRLEDCHVAAQTLRPATEYTGERLYERLDEMMTRPSLQTIEQACEGLARTRKWLPILRRGVSEQKQVFEAELGRPKAYLARLAERQAQFWQRYSEQSGRPMDEETARVAGLHTAALVWENRPHR